MVALTEMFSLVGGDVFHDQEPANQSDFGLTEGAILSTGQKVSSLSETDIGQSEYNTFGFWDWVKDIIDGWGSGDDNSPDPQPGGSDSYLGNYSDEAIRQAKELLQGGHIDPEDMAPDLKALLENERALAEAAVELLRDDNEVNLRIRVDGETYTVDHDLVHRIGVRDDGDNLITRIEGGKIVPVVGGNNPTPPDSRIEELLERKEQLEEEIDGLNQRSDEIRQELGYVDVDVAKMVGEGSELAGISQEIANQLGGNTNISFDSFMEKLRELAESDSPHSDAASDLYDKLSSGLEGHDKFLKKYAADYEKDNVSDLIKEREGIEHELLDKEFELEEIEEELDPHRGAAVEAAVVMPDEEFDNLKTQVELAIDGRPEDVLEINTFENDETKGIAVVDHDRSVETIEFQGPDLSPAQETELKSLAVPEMATVEIDTYKGMMNNIADQLNAPDGTRINEIFLRTEPILGAQPGEDGSFPYRYVVEAKMEGSDDKITVEGVANLKIDEQQDLPRLKWQIEENGFVEPMIDESAPDTIELEVGGNAAQTIEAITSDKQDQVARVVEQTGATVNMTLGG